MGPLLDSLSRGPQRQQKILKVRRKHETLIFSIFELRAVHLKLASVICSLYHDHEHEENHSAIKITKFTTAARTALKTSCEPTVAQTKALTWFRTRCNWPGTRML